VREGKRKSLNVLYRLNRGVTDRRKKILGKMASRGSAHSASEDRNKLKEKAQLQLILWESIVGRRNESRKKVLELLADEKLFSSDETLLDFTCLQANGCKELSRGNKLTVEDTFKYKKYSPLMVAVEEENYDLAKELLEARASVAFKNKVGT